MRLKQAAQKIVTIGIALQLLIATQFATMAQAEMISTDAAIHGYAMTADRELLKSELQRDDVRAELERNGIDPAEADARLAALTDAEIQSMLIQIDDGTAGGDVVGTLVFVFLVLLFTDILCLTNLFSFTRCAR